MPSEQTLQTLWMRQEPVTVMASHGYIAAAMKVFKEGLWLQGPTILLDKGNLEVVLSWTPGWEKLK